MISSVLLLASIAPATPSAPLAPNHPIVSTAARDLAAPRERNLPITWIGPTGKAITPTANPWQANPHTRRYHFATLAQNAPDAGEPGAAAESGAEVAPLLGNDEQALSITAERQEFDRQQNVVAAEGNVTIEFSGGTLRADRVRVNLTDRVALAEGNVVLQRGEQTLRGDRFEYSFVRDSGRVVAGSGEIFQPTANRDFDLEVNPADPIGAPVERDLLSDRVAPEQSVRDISASSGFGVGTGGQIPTSASDLDEESGFNRLRFQADTIDFNREGWEGTNVRITNDPFNPPELEVRANTVNFRRIDAERDEITFTKSRLVFDGNTSVPTFRNRFVLDRRSRPPALFDVGFDNEDRGGLFIDRTFDVVQTDRVRLQVTPQFFVQRLITSNEDFKDFSDSFGAIGRFDARLSRRTAFQARTTLLTLTPDDDGDLRARVRLRQLVGNRRPHTFDVTYNLQERIFNGSLGFQDVDESIGVSVASPRFSFGDTGISLSYRGDVQRITADTDFDEFLDADESETLATLTRFQGVVSADWKTKIWEGEPLEPTPDKGLRYTPTPIVPNVRFFLGASGVFSGYSNGDSQNVISGTVGFQGQFGHFSRRSLSYTAFLISYTNGFLTGESPFLFDRAVDTQRLTLGLTQQIYGPVRLGARTTINLNTGEFISTDYILEYSRRTYNIAIRVNSELEAGSLQLRINAFNFRGTAGPLEQNDIQPVIDGATR